jgi:pimeloyl-ACP methyl ester carboxylesterase
MSDEIIDPAAADADGTGSADGRVLLEHNRVHLALHTLRASAGGHGTAPANLLLLHGLGESSPTAVPDFAADWPGPIHALDFTGHGASTRPTGGGYTAEMLMADADAAVRHLAAASPGPTTIVGRGLGGYIGLLIGGARADQVRGVVIADGPGLSGGPSVPTSQPVVRVSSVDSNPDPYALVELGRDLRPRDYATAFVRLAIEGSGLDDPVTVTARFRPRWLQAVVEQPGVAEAGSIAEALRRYAG